jgi:hypothetical protein
MGVDVGSAVILGLTLTGLVSLAYSLVTGTTQDRVKAALCLVIGIGVTLLVGASDFASQQIVLDRSLASMNIWSQIVVGILLAGIASGVWQGYAAVKNVGENQVHYPPDDAVRQGRRGQHPGA